MKTGTTCARCANASICPAYDARMLYGFCQGFAEASKSGANEAAIPEKITAKSENNHAKTA